jgi:DNA (cytosine-5)-methyltransferase 1
VSRTNNGRRLVAAVRCRGAGRYGGIGLLSGLQPRAFVMENVSGMVKGKMRLIFADVLRELKACGYRVSARLLNAMYFGVPQSRERLIFVGVREDLGVAPSHPGASTRPVGMRQAIELRDESGLRRGWGAVPDGVKNKQFKNRYRRLDLPCVTLEKTRPPIVLAGNVERELTLEECARIGSFPPRFSWGPRAYHCIGNSVPPLFMRAIAAHLRAAVLEGPGGSARVLEA